MNASDVEPVHSGSVRGRLSRERILDAALRVADRGGLNGLSMRALGAELGANPMAVYHHFADKGALMRALVDRVFGGFAPPRTASDDSWDARLRAWAHAYRTLVLEHPGLTMSIVSDAEAVGIAASHVNGPLDDALRAAGLRGPGLGAAIALTVDFVHGASLPFVAQGHVPSDRLEREFAGSLEVIIAGVHAQATRPEHT